jgi:hypothetical protein
MQEKMNLIVKQKNSKQKLVSSKRQPVSSKQLSQKMNSMTIGKHKIILGAANGESSEVPSSQLAKKESESNILTILPIELIKEILDKLPRNSYGHLSMVNKELNSIIRNIAADIFRTKPELLHLNNDVLYNLSLDEFKNIVPDLKKYKGLYDDYFNTCIEIVSNNNGVFYDEIEANVNVAKKLVYLLDPRLSNNDINEIANLLLLISPIAEDSDIYVEDDIQVNLDAEYITSIINNSIFKKLLKRKSKNK